MSAGTDTATAQGASELLVQHRRMELPSEILLMIFTMARDPESWSTLEDTRTMLKNITHVCRRWRAIAIHAPLLWTAPELSSSQPDWTFLVLERLRSQPFDAGLHLGGNLGGEKGPSHLPVLKALLARISRIVRLWIDGSDDELIEAQQLAVMDDASALQKLVIRCDPDRSTNGINSFELLPTTFRNTHQLRELWIARARLGFDSPLLRNLTTLRLLEIHRGPEHTWTAFTAMLNAMPGLEDLYLCHAFPSDWTAVERATPLNHVFLQRLRHLDVESQTAYQMYFFLLLTAYPRSMRTVTAKWHEDDMFDEDHTAVFNVLAERVFAEDYGPSLPVLKVCCQPQGSGADGSVRFNMKDDYHTNTIVEVTVPNGNVDNADPQIITDYIDMFHLTDIEQFDASNFKHFSVEALHHIARRMPLLKRLHLCGADGFEFIELLDMIVEPPEPLAAHAIFQELESIVWTWVDFSGREEWVDNVAVPILFGRREHGFGLRFFVVKYAKNLPDEKDALLERVAEDVRITRA